MDIKLPIDKDGGRIAGVIAVVAMFMAHISTNMGWLGFLMTVGCLAFFRDPERVPPSRNFSAVSPADGIVLKISQCTLPEELDLPGEWKKVSIFMSIFNVHVNRAPVAGTIDRILYTSGKFFNVTLDKASEYNERLATFMSMQDGVKVIFVQIAGLLARRIRCDVTEGQALELGQRVGIIRFGSRVDIYLPIDATILVEEGQVTVGGETVLADLKKREVRCGNA
ncbi:MAG: phosphatidylserine decarboxylase [Holosporaceae bacterium]|jgi:phosphatidylserine decarboxylase|nr:phosphatidylserine decarboxylase [Holosporaceae bacterium]